MEKKRLTDLFNAYYNKTATAAERNEFMDFIAAAENDDHLKTLLEERWLSLEMETRPLNEVAATAMLSKIFTESSLKLNPKPITHRKFWHKMTAAAAIVLVGAALAYLWIKPVTPVLEIAENGKSRAGHQAIRHEKKAILTLADGSEIILDTTRQGTLVKQGNASVIRKDAASLTYSADISLNQPVVYNTLSTPKGGTYQLNLPDGTKVWLNSYSSIHFPSQFKGKERSVSVTGEAYFEVAKNVNMPFKINVNHMEVQVLGTQFNIMAYEDESSINTALLEGSVKVSNGQKAKILVPGQESRLSKTGQLTVFPADLEEVMAWKDGWFSFNHYDIQKIMRQISRWYDVDVVYEGKAPEGHFSGSVKQANDISKVLDIIRAGGVKFKTEGKRIIVLPESN